MLRLMTPTQMDGLREAMNVRPGTSPPTSCWMAGSAAGRIGQDADAEIADELEKAIAGPAARGLSAQGYRDDLGLRCLDGVGEDLG